MMVTRKSFTIGIFFVFLTTLILGNDAKAFFTSLITYEIFLFAIIWIEDRRRKPR